GSPGEAQHILEKAFEKNVFADQRSQDKNKRLLASAKKAAATDLASLPRVEKDAEAAKTGDKDVALGLAYLGYQQYDKAVDALSRALSKGGVRTEPEARLLLGMPHPKADHKAEPGRASYSHRGDAVLDRLANLWT